MWLHCTYNNLCVLLQVKNETLILRIIEKFLNLDGKVLYTCRAGGEYETRSGAAWVVRLGLN